MGRQPWIVQGLLKTADAHSPAVSSAMLAFSLVVFVFLYVLLLVARHLADAPLRDARSARARPRRDRRDPDAGDRILRWTCRSSGSASSASSSPATSCSRASTSASGMLLPFLPRNEEERSTMLRTIGPVWDGNEVWLVVAGGAMFAAFPAWYATMFSGFYIALLLLLVFLIVRVLSFEWRERHEDSRWLGLWAWAEHDRQPRRRADLGRRALEPALRRADQLQRRLRRRPSGTSSACTRCSAGSRSCCCSRSTARPT